MYYYEFKFKEGADDPFSFRIQASVEVKEGEAIILEQFERDKLLGLLSGTRFRVWDYAETPVFEILEAGRDLTPQEELIVGPSPIAKVMGLGAANIFTTAKGAWMMADNVADFDKVATSIIMLDSFNMLAQGCRT